MDEDAWDPMSDAFNSVSFNSYNQGAGANLPTEHLSQFKNASQRGSTINSVGLFVTGLPLAFNENVLRNLFSAFGKVLRCYCVDQVSQGKDKHGFIDFGTLKEAEEAISALNNKWINNKYIKVQFCRNKRDRQYQQDLEKNENGAFKSGFSPHGAVSPVHIPKSGIGNGPNKSVEITDSSLRVRVSNATLSPNERDDGREFHVSRRSYEKSDSNVVKAATTQLGQYLNQLVNGADLRIGTEYEFIPKVCERCQKLAFFRCGNCKQLWYCNQDCQIKDWINHKRQCINNNENDGSDVVKLTDVLYPTSVISKPGTKIGDRSATAKTPVAAKENSRFRNRKPFNHNAFQDQPLRQPYIDKTPPKKQSFSPNQQSPKVYDQPNKFSNAAKLNDVSKCNVRQTEELSVQKPDSVTCKSKPQSLPKQILCVDEEVVTCFALDTWNFYVQKCSDEEKLRLITQTLEKELLKKGPESFEPEIGTICAAQFNDGLLYRARIEKMEGRNNITVFFLDFGNSDTLEISKLKKLPIDLYNYPALAYHLKLIRTQLPKEDSEKARFFKVLENFPKVIVKQCICKGSLFEVSLKNENNEDISDLVNCKKPIITTQDEKAIPTHELKLVEQTHTSPKPENTIYMKPIPEKTTCMKPIPEKTTHNQQIPEKTIHNQRIPEKKIDIHEKPAKEIYSRQTQEKPIQNDSKINWDLPPSILNCGNLEIGTDLTLYSVWKPESNLEVCCSLWNENILYRIKEIETGLATTNEEPLLLSQVNVGELVGAQSEDGSWYRAVVKDLSKSPTSIHVLFVDYGNMEDVKNIRNLSKDDQNVPSVLLILRCQSNPEMISEISINSSLLGKLTALSTNKAVLKYMGESKSSENILLCYPWFQGLVEIVPTDSEETCEHVLFNNYLTLPTKSLSTSDNSNVNVVWINFPKEVYIQKNSEEKELKALSDSIELYCANIHSPNKTVPKIGTYLCARFMDNRWYRGLVLSSNGGFENIEVLLIDYGNEISVNVKDILPMPADAYSTPPLAYCVSLDNVENIDIQSAELLMSKSWKVKITKKVLGKDNLTSVLLHDDQMCINDYISKNMNLGDLVQDSDAKSNPNSTEKTEIFEIINSPISCETIMAEDIPKMTLKIGEETTLLINQLVSPNCFFSTNQEVFVVKEFAKLHHEIQKNANYLVRNNNFQPEHGQAVIAKHSSSDFWCRAVVLNTETEANESHVFFIDYGYYEKVSNNQIYPLPSKFAFVPSQAVITTLYGVVDQDIWENKELKKIISDYQNLLKCVVKRYDEDSDMYYVVAPSLENFLLANCLLK